MFGSEKLRVVHVNSLTERERAVIKIKIEMDLRYSFGLADIRVSLIKATNKTQVASVEHRVDELAVKWFVKRYESSVDYERETFALDILSGHRSVPKIIAALEKQNLIVLEWLPFQYSFSRYEDQVKAFTCLGELHSIGEARVQLLSRLSGHVSVPATCPAVRSCNKPEDERQRPAQSLPSICLGDLKVEHMLCREPNGDPVFVDLETFSVDVPSEIDVAMLIKALDYESDFSYFKKNRLIHAYLDSRNNLDFYDIELYAGMVHKAESLVRNITSRRSS